MAQFFGILVACVPDEACASSHGLPANFQRIPPFDRTHSSATHDYDRAK